MALFSPAPYLEVMRHLVAGLRGLGLLGKWHVPAKSSLFRARQRLGFEPLQVLFAATAKPMANESTPGAFWRGPAAAGRRRDLLGRRRYATGAGILMARHRRPRRTGPDATHRSRRQLAAGLVGASALAATLLTLTVAPPPRPPQEPRTSLNNHGIDGRHPISGGLVRSRIQVANAPASTSAGRPTNSFFAAPASPTPPPGNATDAP
ncbi:transposase domain-containing protein [Streptomyces sp. NPDC005506]|uniref:transposase domain-containing protein n=1 Tax=unclassified Streptomyces TaxID=2593676 RepID=UPI0036A7812A